MPAPNAHLKPDREPVRQHQLGSTITDFDGLIFVSRDLTLNPPISRCCASPSVRDAAHRRIQANAQVPPSRAIFSAATNAAPGSKYSPPRTSGWSSAPSR